MSASDQVLENAEPRGHYVQFYQADEPKLNRNVGRFLWEGLLRGDGLIVIATEQRRLSLTEHLQRLGADVAMALRERQFIILDSEETLDRFMVNGLPDPDLFQNTILEAFGLVESRGVDGGIRAYGEMVGVLWQAGQYEGAVRLEEYWNQLLHVTGISLFCGYPIDVFGADIENPNLHAILCAHTHMVSSGPDNDLEQAVNRAMHDVLGPQAEVLRLAMTGTDAHSTHTQLPAAEAGILWLRQNLKEHADGILSLARNYYDVSRAQPNVAAAS